MKYLLIYHNFKKNYPNGLSHYVPKRRTNFGKRSAVPKSNERVNKVIQAKEVKKESKKHISLSFL